MLLTDTGERFTGGVFETSCRDRSDWIAMGPLATKLLGIGDATSGPLVVIFATDASGVEVDIKAAREHGFVHTHHSDSLRFNVLGDHIVGRDCYNPGDIRLQEADHYYGPELAGPQVLSGKEGLWNVLSFADRRGYRVVGANPKDDAKIEAIEGMLDASYDRVGCNPPLPKEARGESRVTTNLEKSIRGGHLDFAFAAADEWPAIGEQRVALVALGESASGPAYVASKTPAGVTAVPASLWHADLAHIVIDGNAHVDGRTYQAGDLRVQEAGCEQPAIVAGEGGLSLLTIVADRSAARPLLSGAGEGQGKAWLQAVLAFITA